MSIFLNWYAVVFSLAKIHLFLFLQHNMEEYMGLIYRSHLEKMPDKYSVPNPEQATRLINELGVLKPRVTGLDIHQYPNECVLVLKGENLWFSHKICFDEKGEKHEIDTPAESTTRSMIEFRVAHIHKAHSTLSSGKQVKIVLFTHFARPIRQAIDTKKVMQLYIYTRICVYLLILTPAGIPCVLS